VPHELADAIEDVVDRGLVLGQMGTPGVGDLVDLLPLVAGNDPGVAEVLEQLQGGVDRPRARRIGTAELLLERLDDLVAVSRLLLEEAEDEVARVALLDHPPAAPAPARTSLGAEEP